jgi:heme/copper-type cytochrome/quinol oxidase subunit 2
VLQCETEPEWWGASLVQEENYQGKWIVVVVVVVVVIIIIIIIVVVVIIIIGAGRSKAHTVFGCSNSGFKSRSGHEYVSAFFCVLLSCVGRDLASG